MPDTLTALTSLFLTSLLAATILPAQSEIVLGGLHLTGHYHPLLLLSVATTGNVLGACINWLLGHHLISYQDRRWFPASPHRLQKATAYFQKYGVWSLLFAWLPIIGDPLTLAAGILRTPLPLFLLLVTVGKAARYALIMSLIA